jgi:hypothetical protein
MGLLEELLALLEQNRFDAIGRFKADFDLLGVSPIRDPLGLCAPWPGCADSSSAPTSVGRGCASTG